jgi:phosphoribosyl-AMP cyclohydrolase / phosphoribosyl-ATP pyrophosphohydrolase
VNGLDRLKFDANGLAPAVVQDVNTGEVLMLGFMNRAALERTLETRRVTFWSRSRQKFWTKGETSGNVLNLRGVYVNCELNSLLIKAEPVGPTCHEGYTSCYFRQLSEEGGDLLVVAEQVKTPEEIYGRTP